MSSRWLGLVVLAVALGPTSASPQSAVNRGVELAELSWTEAEEVLAPDAVVVLPLGAAAKEHGPHLRLDNDLQIAEYLKRRALAVADDVVAPTVTYHFYPAFLEYPGSTHLSFDTSRDVVVDIVRSLADYGPRRFYVLNTGLSTIRPLTESAEVLREDGILLHFTNILEIAGPATERIREQVRGTHADEIETSMMLYMTPDRVAMSLAVKDDSPDGRGGLTRQPDGPGVYSPSGAWGDATLATVEKGRIVTEATVEGVLSDIAELRDTALPAAAAVAGPSDGADEPAGSQAMPERIDLPGDLDRVLRDYEVAWEGRDADALANLFTEDGFVLRPGRPPVRGRDAIRIAYADSGGPLSLFAYGYAVEGSVGYIIGGFATRPGGDAVGKFVLALRRDASGVWKIAADMDNGN